MERRRNARLDINLQCRITSSRSGDHPWIAVTENMSRGDLLVSVAAEQIAGISPNIGDPLLVEIDLPANHAFGRKCMQCQTTVVRMASGRTGNLQIAMRIHKMRFQDSAQAGVDLLSDMEPRERLLM